MTKQHGTHKQNLTRPTLANPRRYAPTRCSKPFIPSLRSAAFSQHESSKTPMSSSSSSPRPSLTKR
jgi:hypothetical protein